MRNGGLPPTHLPSPSHPPGFLLFKWEQPPKRAPEGDWWLDFPEWWHTLLCHEDWYARACHKDHAGSMFRWPLEWPHPLVMQQDQATHFMQWKHAAGGRPITEYQRGATEGEYMVWKRTLDDVVESAWARHHHARHDRQEAAAARARQEAAAARARQEAAAARALQEAARRQQLLDEQEQEATRARQQEAAHQEAARAAQHLLHERATLERQVEAARCQRLLDKWSALRQRATQARQTAAA
jgi:hypothetical protein